MLSRVRSPESASRFRSMCEYWLVATALYSVSGYCCVLELCVLIRYTIYMLQLTRPTRVKRDDPDVDSLCDTH